MEKEVVVENMVMQGRGCLHSQAENKLKSVIVRARASDVCFFRPGGTNSKSLERIYLPGEPASLHKPGNQRSVFVCVCFSRLRMLKHLFLICAQPAQACPTPSHLGFTRLSMHSVCSAASTCVRLIMYLLY